MDQFPPNSQKARDASQKPPKRVDRVTSPGSARRKSPPLGRQFKETFFGGTAKTAGEYMVFHVMIPAVKEMLVDAMSSGFERLVYGESRPRRGMRGGPNPYGHVNYGSMSQQRRPDDRPPMPKMLSRTSRARQSFDEIIINSRPEAEEVLDRLYDLVSQHDVALVADLYEMTGFESTHVDQQWGWTDLQGSHITHVRGGGYLLSLPEPEPLR